MDDYEQPTNQWNNNNQTLSILIPPRVIVLSLGHTLTPRIKHGVQPLKPIQVSPVFFRYYNYVGWVKWKYLQQKRNMLPNNKKKKVMPSWMDLRPLLGRKKVKLLTPNTASAICKKN